MLTFLQSVAAYGFLGMLIEVVFTGLYSIIIHKNWRATCTTYLWMWPVYGIGGFLLESTRTGLVSLLTPVSANLDHASTIYLGALISIAYLIEIYLLEFVCGYIYLHLFKRKLWDYGASRWTPMGLINFKFCLYWYGLSVTFHFFQPIFVDTINKISKL